MRIPKDLRSDMTIINVVETPTTPILYPTFLTDVFWQNNYAADLALHGIVTEDKILVMISSNVNAEDKLYVGGKEYGTLQDKSSVWTIRKNDCIIRGAFPVGVTALTELRKMVETFTISEYAENLFGKKSQQHYKVIGR